MKVRNNKAIQGKHLKAITNTFLIAIILLVVTAAYSYAGGEHPQNEKWYQEKWCEDQGGQTKYVLKHPPLNDKRSKCDCLTDTHAIEVEFADRNRWYEAIGQSLYYSYLTDRKPGIVLIIKSDNDEKYWIRLNFTIDHFKLPIDTWAINKEGDLWHKWPKRQSRP